MGEAEGGKEGTTPRFIASSRAAHEIESSNHLRMCASHHACVGHALDLPFHFHMREGVLSTSPGSGAHCVLARGRGCGTARRVALAPRAPVTATARGTLADARCARAHTRTRTRTRTRPPHITHSHTHTHTHTRTRTHTLARARAPLRSLQRNSLPLLLSREHATLLSLARTRSTTTPAPSMAVARTRRRRRRRPVSSRRSDDDDGDEDDGGGADDGDDGDDDDDDGGGWSARDARPPALRRRVHVDAVLPAAAAERAALRLRGARP